MPSDARIPATCESLERIDDTSISLKRGCPPSCPVLIVDDDELIVASLARLMKKEGYEVYTAHSGEQALRILNTVTCRMVISDCRMPDMDGLALCRKLRSRTAGSYIYILLHTGQNTQNDILAGFAAGADDYIVKGTPPEEILARAAVGRRITRLEHSLRIVNQENRRLSVTDSLTGVRNRRYLMKYLPLEIARSRRYEHPLAVLSCDIDRFKQINDQFGHEAGDEVLQEFAARLRGCIRDATDWVARTGGEEFMIVLPETNLRGASCVAEKVRISIAGRPFATVAGNHALTVSIGATALESAIDFDSVPLNELLRTADRCLYTSKNLGRDRATAAPPLQAHTLTTVSAGGA